MLTGVCATLPDPEPDVPHSEGGEDEDDNGDGGKQSAETIVSLAEFFPVDVIGDVDDEAEADINMTVDDAQPAEVEATTSFLPSLVTPLLALTHPVALSFPPLAGPSPHPPTTSALSAIHICALECLNNIFLSLATSSHSSVAADKESGQKIWSEIWAALNFVGTETGPGQERRKDFWEVAVGILWGVGTIWRGSLVSNERTHVLLLNSVHRLPTRKKSKF